jgi:hypothetical protein
MSSAQGFPVSWFGFFQLPDLVHRNRGLFETLKSAHDNLAARQSASAGIAQCGPNGCVFRMLMVDIPRAG